MEVNENSEAEIFDTFDKMNESNPTTVTNSENNVVKSDENTSENVLGVEEKVIPVKEVHDTKINHFPLLENDISTTELMKNDLETNLEEIEDNNLIKSPEDEEVKGIMINSSTSAEDLTKTPEVTEEESIELTLVLSESPKEKLPEESNEKSEKTVKEESKVPVLNDSVDNTVNKKAAEKKSLESEIKEPKESVQDKSIESTNDKGKALTEPLEREAETTKSIGNDSVDSKIKESIVEPTRKLVEKVLIKPIETSVPLNKERRESKRKRSLNPSPTPIVQNGKTTKLSPGKRRKLEEKSSQALTDDDGKSDRYCWRCHKEAIEARCTACPRSWHRRCMGGAPPLCTTEWICNECTLIRQAENVPSKLSPMAHVTTDQLSLMLKYVVERMREQAGSAPFLKAVDTDDVPNYLEYIIKPMDLSLLESNVRAKLYTSTDAFMADAKWIKHNCIVFNTYTSKLTNTAKHMLKVAAGEVSEIEACPECFALGRNLPRPHPSWFIQPCRRPHPIVWAKLKGFPFWPAKAISRTNSQGLVDVRFFGEHDRAWVSPKDIYLYSEEPPAPLPKKKKIEMDECMKEVEEHSKKLAEVFGTFRYAPARVQYDPHDIMQIQVILPQYDPVNNKRIPSSREIKTIPLSIKVEKSPVKIGRPKTPLPERRAKTPLPERRPKTPLPEKRPKTPMPDKRSKTPLPEKRPKTPSPKNSVNSSNGVLEAPLELRKSLRRKQMEESQQLDVDKTIPLEQTATVAPKKNTSKNISSNSPINNIDTSSNNDESTSISSSQNKNSEVKNNSGVKKIITKGLKNNTIKKIKLIKDLISKEEIAVTTKSNNLKNGNSIPTLPDLNALNSLKNNPEILKSLKLTHKPKAIYIQQPINSDKTINTLLIDPKLSSSPQFENKIIRVISKAQSKGNKSEINLLRKITNVPKLVKNDIASKPMTAIPMSTEKDQLKAIYQTMNSNTSESARHFNDKEVKLNTSLPVIKQEPKDETQPKLTITRKPSKARKSLPSKPTVTTTNQPINTSITNPAPKTISSGPKQETMVYISGQNSLLRSTSSSFRLPPPEAGPHTANIHNNSKDLASKIAQLIADTIKETADTTDGSNTVNYEAKIHFLKLRIEKMRWEHQQEISELKHNNELVLRELKASMEVERYRALQEARREAEMDKFRCIEETKRKQWCVACGKEAKFYCCWNTAYCDYPCQQKHWSTHFATCNQKNSANNNSTPVSSTTAPVPTTTIPVSQLKGIQKQPMPNLVIYKPKTTVKKA